MKDNKYAPQQKNTWGDSSGTSGVRTECQDTQNQRMADIKYKIMEDKINNK